MNDPERAPGGITLGMGVSQPAGDAGNDEDREIERDLFALGLMAIKELLQIHAIYVFHDHEILLPELAEVVGLDDVRVDQICHQPGFADKVVLELNDGRIFFADQFDGHGLAELSGAALDGFKNQSHAAIGDLTNHLVVSLVEDVFDRLHGVRRCGGTLAMQAAKFNLARNVL